MALKSTICKAVIDIADIDHGYYAQHSLTIACHPSETEERMMVRVIAFVLNAHQVQTLCQGDAEIAFGAGLSDPDDPDLGIVDFTGRVCVYPFAAAVDVWWSQLAPKLSRQDKLEVWQLASEHTRQLGALASRSMTLQATIQDGMLMIGSGAELVTIEPRRLL
jgi:uncharacterized protein YaeQ